MIFAEIITIGDELLIGQVIDTNSAWIGQRLNEAGIKVKQITSISDDREDILKTLREATGRADVIIITGGLGPTKDDITKNTLCEFFNTTLIQNDESLKIVREIFHSRGREMTDTNRLQTYVPASCTVLLNHLGTAPGMLFEENQRIYFSLPGVPHEMKGLAESSVLPYLKKKFSLPPVIHRTILTQGIGESFLSDKIEKWELALPSHIRLAYLPGAGIVRLRLTATGKNEDQLRTETGELVLQLDELIGEYIFGYEDDQLEAIIGSLLREKKKTICTAESCTGGYIAHKITSVPGSSDYFTGSVIAYDNSVKTGLLGIDPVLIKNHGAVSSEVVCAMASSVRELMGADYSIAASGIAGPSGGSEEKPVGTVWLAISTPEKTFSWKILLGRHRLRVIMESANHAFSRLRKELIS